MTEHKSKSTASVRLNPAREKLLSKITHLEETLELVKAQQQGKADEEKEKIVKICHTYLDKAKDYLNRPSLSSKFPFLDSRHPHLIWELLHRVDEWLILLIKDEELYSRAVDVKITFDLNITDGKVREQWIGEKGQFKGVLEKIKNKGDMAANRYVVRDALNLVNEQMDRTFWQLSMNTLTSVWSGMILGLLMLLSWKFHSPGAIYALGKGGLGNHFATLVVLGLIGAYLSNLLTKEDFLYVRGGPFWRYLLHNLLSKPLLSAFAAVFIYILEKSKLIFSITTTSGAGNTAKTAASQLITLNVSPEGEGYVYATLAIVSGFAADKILRSMIDGVLKKLEQKAEKSKDSEKK